MDFLLFIEFGCFPDHVNAAASVVLACTSSLKKGRLARFDIAGHLVSGISVPTPADALISSLNRSLRRAGAHHMTAQYI